MIVSNGYDIAVALPDGLTINATSSVISGTYTVGGSYQPTVTASDDTVSSSQSFAWNVTSPLTFTSPGDQANNESDSVALTFQATETGNPTFTYGATGLPGGLTLNTTSGLVSGTVRAGDALNSPYVTTVTASDGTSTAVVTFTWTISSTVALTNPGDQSNHIGNAVVLPLQVTDSGTGTLTYSTTTLPGGLTLDATSGVISGTISSGATVGSPFTITVTATDGSNSDSQTFTWTVSAAGAVTLTNPGNQSNSEGDTVSLQLAASDTGDGTLSYAAAGLPDGLTVATTTGLISGSILPGALADGPFVTTVTASDGSNSDSQTFTWTVSNPVTLDAVSNQTNTEGDTVSLSLHGTDATSGTLTYGDFGLPFGVGINATTGVISGSIAVGDAAAGPYQTTVTATDGTYSASQTFTWTVNSPLTITNPGDQNNNEGDTVSLQVVASGGTLSYSATGLPDRLGHQSDFRADHRHGSGRRCGQRFVPGRAHGNRRHAQRQPVLQLEHYRFPKCPSARGRTGGVRFARERRTVTRCHAQSADVLFRLQRSTAHRRVGDWPHACCQFHAACGWHLRFRGGDRLHRKRFVHL